MTITLCTELEAQYKAGKNYNSTSVTSTLVQSFINQAEGIICTEARYDFVTNYTGLTAVGKFFLANLASSLAAFFMISYDMSGFTSRTEAQTMLDTNWTIVVESLNLIRDNTFRNFIKTGVEA